MVLILIGSYHSHEKENSFSNEIQVDESRVRLKFLRMKMTMRVAVRHLSEICGMQM